MTSINGTVVTSTIANVTRKSNSDVIPGIMLFLLFAFLVLFLLLMLAFEAYAFVKSKRKGPITLTPVVPFPQDDLQIFKGTDLLRNVVPDAKIQVYNGRTKGRFVLRHPNNVVMVKVNKFMASTFDLHYRLPVEYEILLWNYRKLPQIPVPNNARTISIKMNGYEHGEKCHDFVPIGGAAPGSHFTYQMYGDNRIQVTRYVVDGRKEIAGFCIYIERPWISQFEYRWTLLHEMAKSAKKTMPEIAERRESETNLHEIEVIQEEISSLMSRDSDEIYQDWTIKYCSKRRRKVMTSMDSGEVVFHQEWSDRNNQMRIEYCEECTEEGLGKEEQPPAYSSIFVG